MSTTPARIQDMASAALMFLPVYDHTGVHIRPGQGFQEGVHVKVCQFGAGYYHIYSTAFTRLRAVLAVCSTVQL